MIDLLHLVLCYVFSQIQESDWIQLSLIVFVFV